MSELTILTSFDQIDSSEYVIQLLLRLSAGADPGFGGRGGGGEIRQGDLRVLLLLSHMFMEPMMQEN